MKTNRNKKEQGQMLIMGAILGIIVMVSSYMLFSVGRVTSKKIELQNTADAAAFAAAETMANGISTMGWLNQAMGTIYFYMANHAANVTVESTKMAFVHHAYNGNNKISYSNFVNDNVSNRNTILPASGFNLGSIEELKTAYEKAYRDAYKWIPRGEVWLWQMAKVQRGIAYITPLMAEKEVYLAIQDGRAERAAIFPKFRMYVDPANNFDLEIHKEGGNNSNIQLWDMNGHPGDLVMFVKRDETDFGQYDTDTNLFANDPKIWTLEIRYKLNPDDPQNEFYLESRGFDPVSEFYIYWIKASFPTWENGRFIKYDENGTMIIDNDDGSQVKITQNDDGSTTVAGSDGTVTYRRSGDSMEVKNSSGGWDSMGGVDVEIDGVKVRATNNFNVSVGGITIIDLNTYQIGNTRVHVNKSSINISTGIGRLWLRTENGEAIVNSISTATTDEKWKRRGGSHWGNSLSDQGGDTVRHRMLKIQPDIDWLYQIREIGSYTQDENDSHYNGNGRFSIANGANFATFNLGIDPTSLTWLGKPDVQEADRDSHNNGYVKNWYDLSRIYDGEPIETNVEIDGIGRKVESFHIIEGCWNDQCQVANGNSKGYFLTKYKLVDSNDSTVVYNNVNGQGVPTTPSNIDVEFFQIEMCRICYYNHAAFNKDKRKYAWGAADFNGDLVFPDIKNVISADQKVIVYTGYKGAELEYALPGVPNSKWMVNYEGQGYVDLGIGFVEPRVKSSHGDRFVPKYVKDAASLSYTFGALKDRSSVVLPWDMDHDKDGVPDVIMYPSDAHHKNDGRNIATWLFMDNIVDVSPANYLDSLQRLDVSAPKPLVLSEDFFKFGINVAVTNDKFDKTIKKRFLGIQDAPNTKSSVMTSINPPSWGMIAIASAKCAFWYKGSGKGGYVFSPGDIDWLKDPEYGSQYLAFKNNTNNGDDGSKSFAYDNSITLDEPTEYRMRRQFFVRRHKSNLYTTDWIAKLVPMKFAVRRADLELEDGDDFDTSTRYIYSNLMRTEWRETYVKTSGWKPPENLTLGPGGPSLDSNSEDLEAILTH